MQDRIHRPSAIQEQICLIRHSLKHSAHPFAPLPVCLTPSSSGRVIHRLLRREKQAASAGEINRSIANISKLAEDNYEHMSGIHTSMSELDELATSQARVLSGFTLSRAQGGEEV